MALAVGLAISIAVLLLLGIMVISIKFFGDVIGIFIGVSIIGALFFAIIESLIEKDKK
jgi:hypothetical protein